MIKFLKNPLVGSGILLTGLYFLSGIIDAGEVLNAIPGLGWGFWGLLLLMSICFLLIPVCDFFRLPTWRNPEELKDISEKETCLNNYAKYLLKHFSGKGKKLIPKEIVGDIEQLRFQMCYQTPDMVKIENYVVGIQKTLAEQVVKPVIRSYMKQAALVVIVSPQGWLDSIVLLGLQIKLIKELSSKLGHRPSSVFLICCCIWCLGNSLIAAFWDCNDFDENLSALMIELTGIKLFNAIPGLTWLTGNAVQALYAASSIFVTGHILSDYFLGKKEPCSVQYLLSLRIKALQESKELIKDEFIS